VEKQGKNNNGSEDSQKARFSCRHLGDQLGGRPPLRAAGAVSQLLSSISFGAQGISFWEATCDLHPFSSPFFFFQGTGIFCYSSFF